MRKLLLALLVLIININSFCQEVITDTISFTLDKKLLIFKGKLNGVLIDFAFDTGATLGVVNTDNTTKANINIKNSGKRINDSNNEKIKLKNAVIDSLSIGSYTFTNIKSVMADMEFLQCNGLYLLGMDVIGKLNWKIDFANQKVIVCNQPFSLNEAYVAMPVKNASTRPKTNFVLNNKKYKDCLVDFGYTGTLEASESDFLNELYLQKANTSAASITLSSTMGLSGLGKPDTIKYFLADSVVWANNYVLHNIPITIKEKTELKIGILFFYKHSIGSCNKCQYRCILFIA